MAKIIKLDLQEQTTLGGMPCEESLTILTAVWSALNMKLSEMTALGSDKNAVKGIARILMVQAGRTLHHCEGCEGWQRYLDLIRNLPE